MQAMAGRQELAALGSSPPPLPRTRNQKSPTPDAAVPQNGIHLLRDIPTEETGLAPEAPAQEAADSKAALGTSGTEAKLEVALHQGMAKMQLLLQ